MKVLVTGINGFVGPHVANELIERGHEVIGVGHSKERVQQTNDQLKGYFSCDLTQADQVVSLPINEIDAVINLAGLAKVGSSFNQEDIYHRVNVGILENLGKLILAIKPEIKVLAISSGVIYSPDQPMPLTENSELATESSPYVLSKIAMEHAASKLRSNGVWCIVARPFNHTGPGQKPGFLVPDLYQELMEFKKSGKPVEVGNIKTRRDYSDVRDIAKAYIRLIELDAPKHDVYNICGGASQSGEEILSILASAAGVSKEVKTKVNPKYIRPNDPLELYGDNSRIINEADWKPSIELEQTLQDFVNSQNN